MIAKTAVLITAMLLAQGAVADERPSVSVVGEAEEQARPDIATVILDIVDERFTANEAATENTRMATAVVDGLKGSGVDAKDIATVGLSLTPVMTDQRDPKTNIVTRSVVTSYRAANVVRLHVREIDRAGVFIAASVANGALYQGVMFDIADRETHEDALRTKAAANAMHRAGLYAAGAGAKLGALRSISTGGVIAQPRFEAMRIATAAPGASAPAVVEPGLITLSETVNASWELVPASDKP